MADSWREVARARVFTRPPGTTRREHMRYLDTEIASLESILANAKEIRNMQNLLVSFPEEILVEILAYVRDTAPPSVEQDVYCGYRNPWNMQWRRSCWRCGEYCLWTSATGVCRRMRAVMACGLLHARVWDNTLPAVLLRRSLTRSASIPLDLDLNSGALGSHVSGMEVLKYVKLHRDRVRSLSLHDARGNNTLALHFLQRLNLFTNLKSLKLTQRARKEWGLTAPELPFIIPLNSLGAPIEAWQPPRSITTLYLSIAPFQWTSTIYDGLSELTLSQLSQSDDNAPTLAVIGDLFRRMTRLERLTFDRVEVDVGVLGITDEEAEFLETDRDEEALLSDRTTAFLDEQWQNGEYALPPSLKTWTVAFKPMSMAPFLMRPSDTVKYVLRPLCPPHDSDGTVKRCLSIHFPPPSGDMRPHLGVRSPIVAIDFAVEDGPTSLQASAKYYRRTNTSSDPDLTVHFSTEEEEFTPSDCFFHLLDDHDSSDAKRWFARPDYDQVTDLSLSCVPAKYASTDWRRFARYLPSLKTITLAQEMVPTVVLGLHLNVTPALSFEERHYGVSAEEYFAQWLGPSWKSRRGEDPGLVAETAINEHESPEPFPATQEETPDAQVDDQTEEGYYSNFPIEFFTDQYEYRGQDAPVPEAATGIEAIHVKPGEEYGYASSGYAVHLLLDWLAHRRDMGCPLKELRVPSSLAAQLEECFSDEEGEGGWRSLLAPNTT
ncbi:unnamed protein product [Peniophora sp. CBMAI 1063]|nr:unnamed protein product [Peniophora sp. CBMAI 1063]